MTNDLFPNRPKVNKTFWATFEGKFVANNFKNLATLTGIEFLGS